MDNTTSATDLKHTNSAGSYYSQPVRARVDLDIDLKANQRVEISIEVLNSGDAAPVIEMITTDHLPAVHTLKQLPRLPKLELPRLALKGISINAQLLFGFALGIYFITHLVQLPSFPIYFFCDEAVNPVLAADFIRDGLRNYDGVLFPTFFKNGGQYCLGTSVYLQIIPVMLFGKSVWVTRSFFVILSSLAPIFSAIILRDIFKNRYWWSAPLWLAAIPTWFLHARGAFEYALMVAFYAGFLYFYMRYRSNTPRMLYPALLFGALTFYTYTPGQLIIFFTGILLLVSNWRYHLTHWRTALRGAALLLLLAAPLVRFWMYMPDEYANRLSMYGSYWAADISTVEKISQYLRIYFSGLNPLYWFFPHSLDNPLHTMKGYGHISWLMLPPFLFGIWQAALRFNESRMRVLLAALFAAPTGTAMAALHANRALVIVIPVVILGLIGFSAGLDWLERRKTSWREIGAVAMTIIIAGFSIFMTVDALKNGPTWYSNYGLGGMQWGARQVYAEAREYIQSFPDRTLYISPNWTFQSEVVRNFFAPDEQRIRIGTIDGSIEKIDPMLGQKSFVLMPEEYDRVKKSGRFQEPQVDQIIHYPDGRPGFYFVRLMYFENIEEVIQAEIENRTRMQETIVSIKGQPVSIKHTAVEGDISNLFDGNPNTLVKTIGINPMVVELDFLEPLSLSGVTARVGSEEVRINIDLQVEEAVRAYRVDAGELGSYKDIPVLFDQVEIVSKLRFTLLDVGKPDTNIVHLWEITLDNLP